MSKRVMNYLEDYKKEIVSMLEDVTNISYLHFIYGATRYAYREEQAAKRTEIQNARILNILTLRSHRFIA